MQTVKQAEQHLLDITTERSVYKTALDKAKSSIVTHFSSCGQLSPGAPNSTTITALTWPSKFFFTPMTLYSPSLYMYFLMPYNCAIFVVCCEAIPRQMDEAVDMGKGL